jgi:16S rRNA pseudouridine516 synthase
MRLDRLLANLGYGSRREVQKIVAAGLVTLDGAVLIAADRHVPVTSDLAARMSIDGAALDPPPPLTLLMHTVGRLDKETSGLLLLTDDGGLLHRIISPKAEIAKRYRVTLERPLTGGEQAMFASGAMILEGEAKPLLPASLEVIGHMECWLTIAEGRYHQVRRMFEAVGNFVTALHRDRIGGFDLPHNLDRGEYRPLRADELAQVFGGSPQF